jgi:hypothetical protein
MRPKVSRKPTENRDGFIPPYAVPSTGAFERTNRQDSRFACIRTRRAKNNDVFRETDIKISRRVSDTKHESLLTGHKNQRALCHVFSSGALRYR